MWEEVQCVYLRLHLGQKPKIGEFLCSHFNTVEEDMQRFQHITLYYFKKGETHLKRKKKICAVYGQGAKTDQMCQKCFAKFLDSIDILAK